MIYLVGFRSLASPALVGLNSQYHQGRSERTFLWVIEMSEAKEISVIPPKESALAVYSVENGLDPYLAKIRAEIDGFTPDVSTSKGRQAIASIAYSVARSKTALDGLGKELVAELKEVPKRIDAERKRMRETLDSWQAEVRRPLTEWQAAEDARVDRHNDGIEWFRIRAEENSDLSSDELVHSIEEVESYVIDESWQEFEAEAHRIKARALASLKESLDKRIKADNEAAELARFRKEVEERAEADRIAEAKRVAVEAERQRVEKERRDQQEENDRLIRKAELEREQAMIDKEQAELRSQQAERDRIAAVEQAERDRIAAEERAERQRIQAEKLAEQERIAANERQKRAEEKARQDEIDRQAREAQEVERQRKAREQDQAHKIKVMGAAKKAIMGMNVSEELAKAIVLKIARGEVPNITINF